MKRYISILFVGLAVAALCSCGDDFLDTEPKGSNAAGMSMTGDDAEYILTGCYDGYQQAYSYGGPQFYVASEIMSDDCFDGGGTGDDTGFQAIDEFDKGLVSNSAMMEDYWKKYYTTINRCNSLLDGESAVAWSSDAQRRNTIGQCRAIRALCYFDLTRLYGSVPLLTSCSVEKVKESAPAEIFEVIASDLKYAADSISFGAYNESTWESTYHGLISEWAAKALLARVYLFYTGFYGATLEAVSEAEVKAYLVDIINNGGFALLDNFKDLWPASSRVAASDGSHAWATDTYAGEANKEVLFNLEFDPYGDSQGTNENGAIALISMRNVCVSPYANGWGVAPVNSKLYYSYLSGDTRRDASIINLVGEGIEDTDAFAQSTDWRHYSGFSIKKYSATAFADGTRSIAEEFAGSENSWQYRESQDYTVMRYADVLLMAAEMGCDGAQTYYNMVRDRAFGDSSHHKTVSKDNILEERHFEFAFEGLRYWDLLRTKGVEGTAAILEANQNGQQVTSAGEPTTIHFSASNMINCKGLLLKPNNQITLMGSDYLSQNAGW